MRSIVVALALPPTGLVLLIVVGLLLRGGWLRFGRRLAWMSVIALLLLGMPVVSHGLLLALETGLPTTPPADHPPRAIVVLGGEIARARTEALGIRPGLLTLDRLRTAAALHRRTDLPILVTGGTTQPDTAPVALAMAQSLKDDFQAPAKWVETKSVDTWENARLSADILRPEGITSVYIVTHAWHMRRAVLAFEGTGLTVTAAPTSLDDALEPTLYDLLPRASAWQTGYFALHEWIGYAWPRSADLTVETFADTAALPPGALSLLHNSAGLFASRTWWDVVLRHAMPADARAAFLTIRASDRIVALLPLLRTGHRLRSLTTPYSCEFMPLFAAGLDRATRIDAMAAWARDCRRAGVIRIDALKAEGEDVADLEAGARRAGLRPIRFNHFGNWQENVAGLDWAAYLRQRPGALRATIRRRSRQAADGRFELLTHPAEVDRAILAFEAVYRRSWKDPEPYPNFNAALIRATSSEGSLRLGVWSVAHDPVAVQFWVVRDGAATVLKLAHDEAFKALSPGTILTALMLRHLLDEEHVGRIDFGRGDDPYKQAWATQRRQRVGLLLANPWRPAGALALIHHAAGRITRGVPLPTLAMARLAGLRQRAPSDERG